MLKEKITKEKFKEIVDKVNRKVWIWDEAKQDFDNVEQKRFQYSLPTIEFVGDMNAVSREEAHDAVISFLVDKYLKDYDCHVFKFKGKTYIRIKNHHRHHHHHENEGEVDLPCTTSIYASRPIMLKRNNACRTIAEQYSRSNNSKYRKGKK